MRVSTACRSFLFAFLLLLALPIAGCKDYPYTSPTPGVLEVRLKTVSESLPYGEQNSFPIQLTAVRAVRSDNAKQEVFEDLRAIRRYTDYFDAFSRPAFDSTVEIGQAYSPPGSYIGLDITMQPIGGLVLDGYRFIDVRFAADAESFLRLRMPITIQEARTTLVTVTFNVDSSLTRGAEEFYYHPKFYISSIQIR